MWHRNQKRKMGKEGELWDDSALINAFDNAMSKYKKMHAKKTQDDDSTNEPKISNDSIESVSAVLNQSHEAVFINQRDQSINVALDAGNVMEKSKDLAPDKGNQCADSIEPESHVDLSNGLRMQAQNGYSVSQSTEDYNQLLSQYYELEAKRQMILQQLQQFGYYNYQGPAEASVSGVQWGTCSTSQDHSVPPGQQSLTAAVCSCCPYACPCSAALCTSSSGCSLGGICVHGTCSDSCAVAGAGKSRPPVDGDIVKTAMGAAEKALSSLKTNTFVDSAIQENDKKKETEGEMAQKLSSQTDISVVLNAWYSAGFYTGKYLTEQSIGKN